MSISIQSVIDRVKKLLRLAKSDNIHEAAKAAEKANDLITKFNIDKIELLMHAAKESDATISESIDNIARCPIKSLDGNIPAWMIALANGVSGGLRCSVWWMRGHDATTLHAAGMPDDIAVFAATFDEYCDLVERLYKGSARPTGLSQGTGKRWSLSFRIGAAEAIAVRLNESNNVKSMKENLAIDHSGVITPSQETAIATISNRKELADQWIDLNMPELQRHNAVTTVMSDAFDQGHQAGSNADLSINQRKRLQ